MTDTMNDNGAKPMHGRPMAIKNLIPSLPERGKIKIGMKGPVRKSRDGKEFQIPQKLDHFVITTLTRGQDGNYIPDGSMIELLGEKPKELPIRMLYDDPTLNFPTRYAAYQGQKLFCSGDGEVAQQLIRLEATERKAVQCPCFRQDPSYTGKDKCKVNGALSVIIDGAGGVGGVWKFRTTSYNSVVGIMSSMMFIKSITGGPLANLPLTLAVRPKQVADPAGNQQTVYVVQLEYKGTIADLQKTGHQIALDRATTQLSIQHIEAEARRMLLPPPDDAPLPGDDPEDVRQEFYPDNPESGEYVDEDGVVHDAPVKQGSKLETLEKIIDGQQTSTAPAEPAKPAAAAKPAPQPAKPKPAPARVEMPTVEPTGDANFDEAAAAAAKGSLAFTNWWNSDQGGKTMVGNTGRTKRAHVNDRKDKLQALAKKADAAIAANEAAGQAADDPGDDPAPNDDPGDDPGPSDPGVDIEAGLDELINDLSACTTVQDINLLSDRQRGFIVGLPDPLRQRWATALSNRTNALTKARA